MGPNHAVTLTLLPAMPRNPVFRCPIEIWDVIFALACDHSGKIAAAICGVSRYFYEIVKPHRLKSLVVYGESRIVAFHKAMKIIPPDVPRAEHLFIALIPDSFATETDNFCGEFIDGWAHHRGETEDQRNHRISRNSNLSSFGWHPTEYTSLQEDVVRGVISHHRETLRTLTYLTRVSHINFEMFGFLPKLEDLTLVCLRYKSTFYAVHRGKPVCQTHQFHSLKRLHVSYFDTEPLFRHDEFRRIAPEITHLRISGRECYPQYDKLPPHTKVFIQMILMSSQEQGMQISHMRDIFSTKSDEERTVLLEPGHREEGRYGFFDALLDWLDVSAGRNAFWESENMVTIDQLAAR